MPETVTCRYAPSLGALEGTPEQVWGTKPYIWRFNRKEPCVFFGLYDLRDYLALAVHQGKTWVLWAGSDIRNLSNGFLLNDGKLRTLSILTRGRFHSVVWKILQKAEHWVENEVEKEALEKLGVKVTGVCPSWMGPIGHKIAYKPSLRPNVYVSASEGRQEEYGFGIVERIAPYLPKFKFHLYGASWETKCPNVIVHGRVPKSVMNEEIKGYQIGLRLNDFDGFSEVLAKAVLQGQYAVGRVKHPLIPSFGSEIELVTTLNRLGKAKRPNLEAREWYVKNLNNYPWNTLKRTPCVT